MTMGYGWKPAQRVRLLSEGREEGFLPTLGDEAVSRAASCLSILAQLPEILE